MDQEPESAKQSRVRTLLGVGLCRVRQAGNGISAVARVLADWLRARLATFRRLGWFRPAGALRLLVVLPRPLVSWDGPPGGEYLVPETLPGQESYWGPLRLTHEALFPELLDQAFSAQRAPLVVRYLYPPTLAALQEALSGGYHALVFDGPSQEDGTLFLEGVYGESHAVAARALGHCLGDGGVRFVWLRARHASAAGRNLRQTGIIVIDDTAGAGDAGVSAAALAACFAALSRGRNVRQALAAAREVFAAAPDVAAHGTGLELHARRWPPPRLLRPGAKGEYHGEGPSRLAPPPISLVGREVDMAQINRWLARRRLVVLVGAPGMGKTALARAVARWHWERGQASGGVYFIPLHTLPSGADLLDELLGHLLPGYRAPPGLDGERLRQHKISRLSARLGSERWLLVLDDVGAVCDAAAAAFLSKLLRRCGGLHLLLTANERLGLAEEVVFPVGPLGREPAVQLFCRQSGQHYGDLEQEQVAAVCEALGRVPLAIVLVARCSPPWPADLLEVLCQRPTCSPVASYGLPAEGAGDDELVQPQGALRQALGYSYRQLSAPARCLLGALTVFRSGARPEALQAVLRSMPDHGPALDELLQRNLVERNPAGEGWRYRVASSITPYASQYFHQEEETFGLDQPLLYRTFVDYFFKAVCYPAQDLAPVEVAVHAGLERGGNAAAEKVGAPLAALDMLDGDRANLLAATEAAYEIRAWEATWKLARRTAELLSPGACWVGGERTYLLALDAARRRGDSRAELEMLDRVGHLYARQGRWLEATACFEHALVICDELNDPGAEGRMRANLGTICAGQGHWDKAVTCYEQALQCSRQVGDHREEGRTLSVLARIRRRQNHWNEALYTYQQALWAFRQAKDRQGEIEALNHLGNICCRQSRWDESVHTYEESLRHSRDLPDRRGESEALRGLGYVYQLRGGWAEAAACYEQDLVICRQLDNPYGEGRTLTRLGLVQARQGHWAAAIRMHEEALQLYLDLEDRQEQGRVLTALSEVYRLQGQRADALAACQRALHLLRKCGGYRREGQALAQLGLIHASERRWRKAIAAYQRAQFLFRRAQDRCGEGQTLAHLGLVYAHQARWVEAGQSFQEGLEMLHPMGVSRTEATILCNLGQVYTWQGRWASAVACYEQVLTMRHALRDRRVESRVLGKLGNLYRLQQKWKEAASCYKQSLAICEGVQDRIGEGRALANLAGIHERRGRWVQAISLYQASYEAFQKSNRRHDKARVLIHLGLVYAHQSRWAESGRTLQQGLEILRELGDHYGEGQMLRRLARIHLDQGHLNQALDLYHQGLAIFRSTGRPRCAVRVLNGLGTIHQLQGRWTEAITCYEQALAIRRQTGDRPGEGQALGDLGGIYRREGRWAEATACYEQALALYRQLGDHPGESKVLSVLAGVQADRGDYLAAITTYYDSVTVLRAVHDRYGEAQALTALGLVHARQGDVGNAVVCWYRALAIYEPLQAQETDQVRGLLKAHLTEGQEIPPELQKASPVDEDDL